MIKTSTLLLGAGLLATGVGLSAAARADAENEALAFIVGAAVGHVISDGDVRVRHVHGRHYGHSTAWKKFRWHQRHKARHRHWERKHHRFDRRDRFDHKRDHRRDQRHQRRDRRHDRWDRRHDRWDHRRDRRDDRRHGRRG